MADHFYTLDAQPAHNLGLREARRLGCYPSVTTILRILNKPGINDYLINQSIMAALTLLRHDDESDEAFVQRIIQDGKDAGEQAAAIDSTVHEVVNRWFRHRTFEIDTIPADLTVNALELRNFLATDRMIGDSEIAFAYHRRGYGGQIDFIGLLDGIPVIADFKTQYPKSRLKSGQPSFTTYPEWAYQLAAYRAAVTEVVPELSGAQCASVIVSVNPDIPGIKVKLWPENHDAHMNMDDASIIFQSAVNAYRALHKFGPVDVDQPTTVNGRVHFARFEELAKAG